MFRWYKCNSWQGIKLYFSGTCKQKTLNKERKYIRTERGLLKIQFKTRSDSVVPNPVLCTGIRIKLLSYPIWSENFLENFLVRKLRIFFFLLRQSIANRLKRIYCSSIQSLVQTGEWYTKRSRRRRTKRKKWSRIVLSLGCIKIANLPNFICISFWGQFIQ